MIGNDLVYFLDWPRRSGNRLERFRKKVFTDSEIAQIENSEDPFLSEALFWSAKEATYKAWFKESRSREFSPKKFEVLFVNRNQKAILLITKMNHFRFQCLSKITDNFIHTLAHANLLEIIGEVNFWQGNHRPDYLNFQEQILEIEKDSDHVPYAIGLDQKFDLSISYDGGRTLCVWL